MSVSSSWPIADIIAAITSLATTAYFVATVLVLRAMRRANAIATAVAEANAADTQAALAETRRSNELTQQHVRLAEAALAETKQSNELTIRSLQIAQTALEFNRQSFELAHQPTVHVIKIDTSGPSSVSPALKIGVSLRNSGTSDAHDAAIVIHLACRPINIDEPENYIVVPGQPLGFVMPNVDIAVTVEKPAPPEITGGTIPWRITPRMCNSLW